MAQTAEGGREIRILANQGRDADHHYTRLGYNYRMTNIQAALGLGQLERLDSLTQIKTQLHAAYRNGFASEASVYLQSSSPDSAPCYWFTAIRLRDANTRKRVEQHLQSRQIPYRRIFQPLPQLPMFSTSESHPNAVACYQEGLCLPSSTLNTPAQCVAVAGEVIAAL